MARYETAITVEAHRWDGDRGAVDAWLDRIGYTDTAGIEPYPAGGPNCLQITGGEMHAWPGDWLVFRDGELLVVSEAKFRRDYRPVAPLTAEVKIALPLDGVYADSTPKEREDALDRLAERVADALGVELDAVFSITVGGAVGAEEADCG